MPVGVPTTSKTPPGPDHPGRGFSCEKRFVVLYHPAMQPQPAGRNWVRPVVMTIAALVAVGLLWFFLGGLFDNPPNG